MIPGNKKSVLVVEDDPCLVELLRYNLEREGFSVFVENGGENGALAVIERDFAAIILDWMMPNMSGIDLVRLIRQLDDKRDTPVIMLTARGEEEDRVEGLDSGADDYVVKPFSPKELIARLRALLRRSTPGLATGILKYADLELDLETHKARRSGSPIHLSPREFDLLRSLMEKPGWVRSREQLLNKVWGHEVYVEDRTVDVHIRRLRKALTQDGKPEIIRTVRGAGYALDIEKD